LSASRQWEFLEKVGLLWQEHPELSFGKFIYKITKNPTELYMLENKEILKRLSKEYDNE
jgi:hypothetical protein